MQSSKRLQKGWFLVKAPKPATNVTPIGNLASIVSNAIVVAAYTCTARMKRLGAPSLQEATPTTKQGWPLQINVNINMVVYNAR